jgi:hypothetical protein
MDATLKKTGITCIIAGLVISAIAPTTGALVESSAIRSAGSLAAGLGTLVFIYGCVQIAKAKGQPWYFGLLGFLSCLGLAILWFAVPDKQK